MENLDPWIWASLDPQGLHWQDLCRGLLDIKLLLHTKYILFQRGRFLNFSLCKSMENLDPWGRTCMNIRDLTGRIYIGEH